MSEIADIWGKVADDFTSRVDGVGNQWEAKTPCEGWVARDILIHLAQWVPPFLEAGASVRFKAGPDPAADPEGAWAHLNRSITKVLGNVDMSATEFKHEQAGTHRLDHAISMFILSDVLIHTWDLAKATGQDATLNAEVVARELPEVEPITDKLVASGHYKTPVPVAADRSPQDRLLGLMGRNPDWVAS